MIAGKEGIYLRRVEDVLYMDGTGQTCFRSIDLIASCLSLQNLEIKQGLNRESLCIITMAAFDLP
jgi:hypothetical protein